ncbi:MAG: hypothetical protein DCF31_13310 [Alphaproteobacteria bacterium]|nr:MAG: hypothetical protein DCF31_13310 [Alphaproteobacteria bacterium]
MQSLVQMVSGAASEREASDAMAALGVLTAAGWDWTSGFDQARAAATMATLGAERPWAAPPASVSAAMAGRLPELAAAWRLSFAGAGDDGPARLLVRSPRVRWDRATVETLARVLLAPMGMLALDRLKDRALVASVAVSGRLAREVTGAGISGWTDIDPGFGDEAPVVAPGSAENLEMPFGTESVDVPPAGEADRFVDLALLADHYAPGDAVAAEARLPATAGLEAASDHTLEVAIRAARLGFGGSQRPVKAPRQQQEPITVYARVTGHAGVVFDDTLLPLTWPHDADSTPAFFRFRTAAAFTDGVLAEVRLLSADLRLLDQVELVCDHGQWQVRAVDAAIPFARPASDAAPDVLALHVNPAGAGYAIDATLTRAGAPPLALPIGQTMLPADIAGLLAAVRNVWTKLVIGTLSDKVTLSAPSYRKACAELAAHGRDAWRLLFGDGRGSQAGTSEAFGTLLAEHPLPPDSVIRITCADAAQGFVFPWTIVCPPAAPDAEPQFWGLDYRIEIARKQGRSSPPKGAPRINAVVDAGFARFVDHPATLADVTAAGSGATLAMAGNRKAIDDALAADDPAELFYFFCHGIMGGAASGLPADIAAVIRGAAKQLCDDAARAPWDRLLEQLAVTDGKGARIFFGTAELTEQSLRDSEFFKAHRRPLVFLNMCHSAATLPASRAGLPAVFLDRDAVAVIGTESPINAQFGDAFARELLPRLLAGEPLGAAMLASRRIFHAARNPLGLTYVVYGRGDTMLAPAAGGDRILAVQREDVE